MTEPIVDTRSELMTLLSQACELEHGLACAYLFAGFSLKDGADGLTFEDEQRARRWAAQLYFVASQEMLHLAQAWNLLAAIGGTPYHGRPSFPESARNYPLNLPLELLPFSPATIDRFVAFEAPEELANVQRAMAVTDNEQFDYRTVGELYSLIASGFTNIAEDRLFIGEHAAQVGPRMAHFPDIVSVIDRRSAIEAIDRIKAQGEGAPLGRVDSHFGIFSAIADELRAGPSELGRACAANPVTSVRPEHVRRGPDAVSVIEHPDSATTADLFDDIYVLMLRMLAFVFEPNAAAATFLHNTSRIAIELMVTVLKPMGEALTMMPLGDPDDVRRAGAPFAMTRVVQLPSAPATAQVLLAERLAELASTAERVATAAAARHPRPAPRLAAAARTMRRLGDEAKRG